MVRRFAAAALFALAPALTHAADSDSVLSGYALTSWHDDAGRPLGPVYAIEQDGDGYLWIGTDAGLLRFDGWRFTSSERLSNQPSPGSSVRALHRANDGRLFVGFANRAGVGEIRGGQFVVHGRGLEGLDAVTDLVVDGRGVMWAIADRLLYTLHSDRWQRVRLPWAAREGQVQELYVSRRGQLWVGTRWGVFEHLEASNSFRRVANEHTWGITEDPAGRLWTSDIVSGFRELGASAPAQHSVEGAGYRLTYDHHGDLWVGTFGHGLWHVDGSGGRYAIERAALSTGLSSNSIQSMLVDRHGNVWVGTTGGLHRLTKRTLTPLESVGFVLAVQPEDDGRVIAGTTNGIVRFEADGRQWRQIRLGTAMPDTRALYRDADGTLWVGASDGLWRYSREQLSKVHLPSRSDELVLSVSPDPRGGLWLGDGEWLYRWHGATLEPLALPAAAADLTRVTSVRADRSGRVWLGFDGKAIGRLERDGAFAVLGADNGFTARPNETLHAAYEDADGVVWLGTSAGLHRFAGGRVTSVGRAHGLPNDRVWAITEDRQRHLWLSLDRGLVRLRRDEFAKAAGDPAYRMRYQIYDPFDGLAGAPLGIINAARQHDGGLWFVRGGGVTFVNPQDLPEPGSGIGPLRIEEAIANDQWLSPSGHTLLSPGTRRLQVSYTAHTIASSDRVHFRHKLEGFDADWVDAGAQRTAFYTNLSPRNYTFRVEARSEEGTWTTTSAAWTFTIQPAIYQTTWFYALCACAAAGTIGLGWNFRLRLMRRQFSLMLAERARLSREIHDTLLQSLVGVALQFDGITTAIDPQSVSARNQLVRVRRQVEAYIREARQSIHDLRSPLLETRDLATALREFAKNAVADSGVRVTSNISGTSPIDSPKVENQLLRIGQEAITNAIRHGRPGRIHLELTVGHASISLMVSDNGCGFEDGGALTDAGSHYGLTTMRERAEELGGTLTISTAVGRGTSVEAVIPLASANGAAPPPPIRRP